MQKERERGARLGWQGEDRKINKGKDKELHIIERERQETIQMDRGREDGEPRERHTIGETTRQRTTER